MAVNRERKQVWEEQTTLDFDYDTLGQALKRIEEAIAYYGADAKIFEEGESYSNSDRKYLRVKTQRLENDAEYNKRIAYEEQWTAQQVDRDRAEFERLKKQFGDK